MNVDSQFPQPLTPVQPYRPPAKPAEQAIERPVDTPKSAEATADKPRQDTVQARSEEQEPRSREGAREPRSESGQGRSVAVSAPQIETDARQELTKSKNNSSGEPTSPAAERIQNASAEPAPVGELLDVIV